MKAILVTLALLATVACEQVSTNDSPGLRAVVTEATPTPANVRGGIVKDYLPAAQAKQVRENAIDVPVPYAYMGKRDTVWMRKTAEWKGTGNASFSVSDLPAGDVTLKWEALNSLVVSSGGYAPTFKGDGYNNLVPRDAKPMTFTVLANGDKEWTIIAAMPVPVE